jgi:hypothetical protein
MSDTICSLIPLIGTTDSSGAATITSSRAVNGLLFGFYEDKGTLADGVDFTITVINSEMICTILTLTNANTDQSWYFPRGSSCDSTGTSTVDNQILIPVNGKLQCVIAQGGNTFTGGMYAFVME